MMFYINTENSSGMKFKNKEEFLAEIKLMVETCIANGGNEFSIEVYTNAECFRLED